METESNQVVVSILFASITLALLSIFAIAAVRLFIKRKMILQEINSKQKAEFEKLVLQKEIDIQKHTAKLIADELHDNISQSVSTINYNISGIETNDEYIKFKLSNAEKLLAQVIGELRIVSRILNDKFKDNNSFVSIITKLVEIVNNNGLKLNLFVEGEEVEMLPTTKFILYRILQESINNATKHSEATLCELIVKFSNSCVDIIFIDNGKGFDIENVTKGMGLTSMKEKSEVINAKVKIESVVGKGTKIFINTPHIS